MEAALPAVLEALERAAAQACRRHVPPAPPTPWPATRDPNVLALARPWLSRRNAKASVVHGGLDERRPPPAVEPYEVPILLARPRDLLRLSSHRYGDDAWDLAVQQVIPHVDGVRSAKQLARAARVDLDVVLRSLRVLRHYRCLAVVDTFQYQNVYRATDRLSRLAASRRALEGCARFCFRGEARKSLQGLDALRLYCAFQDARSVKDVLLEAARAAPKVVAALDARAFVAFGLVHGRLVRVHRFPVAVRAARAARRRRRPSWTGSCSCATARGAWTPSARTWTCPRRAATPSCGSTGTRRSMCIGEITEMIGKSDIDIKRYGFRRSAIR